MKVPFTPGRTDASQEQTDVDSFAAMEPTADGFRNYIRKTIQIPAEEMLIDRAQLLTLTAPEMTILVGGMRALSANGTSKHGGFTSRPETLTIAEWNVAMMVNLARDLRQLIRNQEATLWDRSAVFQREIR